jgi:hypothetical protein
VVLTRMAARMDKIGKNENPHFSGTTSRSLNSPLAVMFGLLHIIDYWLS